MGCVPAKMGAVVAIVLGPPAGWVIKDPERLGWFPRFSPIEVLPDVTAVEVATVFFRFQQSGFIFFCSSAKTLAFVE